VVVIGLIGPIAAGKSVVMDEFRRLGAATIAADEVSRTLMAPGNDLLERVIEEFGESFRGEVGGLHRAKLGALVFADDEARRRLEQIVHPAMVDCIAGRIREFRREGAPAVVVEAANLIEMGARPLVDVTVMVSAPRKLRLQRLMARDGLTRDEADRRLALHRRLAIEQHRTDFCIDTSGGQSAVRYEVQRLWDELVQEE